MSVHVQLDGMMDTVKSTRRSAPTGIFVIAHAINDENVPELTA